MPSDCTHCWHITHQWSDSFKTHRNETCCHCGQRRTEHVPHPPHHGWREEREKHGPHYPETRPMWTTSLSPDSNPGPRFPND